MSSPSSDSSPIIPGFRPVPRTGVIYVTHRAIERGFSPTDPQWSNLGQGAPETGMLPGGVERITDIPLDSTAHEYAPVAGLTELRQKVADFYNALYRQGKSSQYTAANVAISSGGRVALTRIAASLGNINMGHVIPDYTAYEELLSVFKAFTPIPLLLKEEDGYRITTEKLQETITGLGLGALLVSNPCNPTGQHIRGEELRSWVDLARASDCTLLLDEFYSHYLYDASAKDAPHGMASAAAYVEDVDADPVIIVDGLTKNWRYPGLRLSWTVGPKSVTELLASAGSFLDGGAPHVLQIAALPLLDPEAAIRETQAIHSHFSDKRSFMMRRLEEMGIRISHPPQGAFYCWADISALPSPLNEGLAFFEEALRHKVITVPGIFFDVNPGKRRASSRYDHFVRISFGPDMASLRRGLDAMERMINDRHPAEASMTSHATLPTTAR